MADAKTEPSLYEQAHSACVEGGFAEGMPQLCGDWFGHQIFWLIVTLGVIYFLMARVALPRIASVLADRQDAVQNDLDKADELKSRAHEAEEAYKKALAQARAEANAIIAETRADIQKDLNAAMAKADAEIAEKSAESEKAIRAIRDNALQAVDQVAKDTSAAIVEAVMPGSADQDALAKAVEAQLKG
ncbi:MAG: F0F1 ATP synthase subunit B' [Pseudomonadota bacterium]